MRWDLGKSQPAARQDVTAGVLTLLLFLNTALGLAARSFLGLRHDGGSFGTGFGFDVSRLLCFGHGEDEPLEASGLMTVRSTKLARTSRWVGRACR